MDDREVRERLVQAAGDLFYRHGIAAVGMDDIRAASGVPLKRLYQCFSSKDALVEAYLSRRDEQWLAALAERVERSRDPRQRVLAVFGFLAEWFATPGFRGCAFINAVGELGGRASRDGEAARAARAAPVTSIAQLHKKRLRRYLAGLAADAGAPAPSVLGAQLLILMDGAIVSAATGANVRAAADARAAARTLLEVACEAGGTGG